MLCLAVAPKGGTLYSGASDRSIRVWAKTDEIVFLEEEQEKRLEAVLEKGVDEVTAPPVVGSPPLPWCPMPWIVFQTLFASGFCGFVCLLG